MASHLDLEEQEQLDDFKHFWNRWGNLISWILILILGSYASWNGWQYWQRQQAAQAAVLFETVEKAITTADIPLLDRSLADMKDKFGSTTFAHQSAMLASRVYADQNDLFKAQSSLEWVLSKSNDSGYQSLARLRLSTLAIENKKFDQAKSILDTKFPIAFQPLVDDRLGDVALLENKPDQAKTYFLTAWKAMDVQSDYRQILDMKLAALGVDPKLESASK